jgi:general secretion pathway protein J
VGASRRLEDVRFAHRGCTAPCASSRDVGASRRLEDVRFAHRGCTAPCASSRDVGASRRLEDVRFAHRGFTLIEVMMAVVIVAIMATLVWSSFGRLLNVSRELGDAGDHWHGVRVAMNRIAREVSAAFISDNYDPNRFRQDDPRSRPTLFVIEDRGDRGRLAFTAFVNRRLYMDEKVSDQAVVEYFVDRDRDGRTHLFRRQKNILDGDWDRGGEVAILIEDVAGFQVEWWDPERERWMNEYDTRRREQHERIPSRIRVHVRAVDPDGVERTYTTQTRVMLTRPLRW